LKRVSKKTDAIGNSMAYGYDEIGRLEKLINENQESYHFEYDLLDRLKKEQGLDGLISEYHYDEIDNLLNKRVTTTEGETQETNLQHNPIGEYSYKSVELGDKLNQSAYKYDLRGNLIEALNKTNRVTFEYNELGLITKETTSITQNEDEIEKVLEHEYDELGNRIKTTLPDKREVEYSYNALGAVEEIRINLHPCR
jgi:YD repeat-containing protein